MPRPQLRRAGRFPNRPYEQPPAAVGARESHIDWIRSIRDQCIAAGIPFWFKGYGVRCRIPFGGQGPIGRLEMVRTGSHPDYARLLDGREWNEVPK
jgi:protein gp37